MFHLSFYPFEGWTDRRMDYSTSLSIALADRRVGIRPTLTVTNRPVTTPQGCGASVSDANQNPAFRRNALQFFTAVGFVRSIRHWTDSPRRTIGPSSTLKFKHDREAGVVLR